MDTRFDLDEVKQSCILINTADYCQTTALEVMTLTMNATGRMRIEPSISSAGRENSREGQP